MERIYKLIENAKENNLEEMINIAIKDEIDIENCIFKDQSDININTENIEFKKCLFQNCKISGKLEKTYFTFVIFENCDFSNFSFEESNFNNVYFKNCKFIGSNFIMTRLNQIEIIESNFKYSNFSNSNIKECNISNSDFSSSEFEEVIFNKLDLKEVSFISTRFFKTKLGLIDFRDCNIDGISAEIKDLKDMIVTEYQAMELSKMLGIIIK